MIDSNGRLIETPPPSLERTLQNGHAHCHAHAVKQPWNIPHAQGTTPSKIIHTHNKQTRTDERDGARNLRQVHTVILPLYGASWHMLWRTQRISESEGVPRLRPLWLAQLSPAEQCSLLDRASLLRRRNNKYTVNRCGEFSSEIVVESQ